MVVPIRKIPWRAPDMGSLKKIWVTVTWVTALETGQFWRARTCAAHRLTVILGYMAEEADLMSEGGKPEERIADTPTPPQSRIADTPTPPQSLSTDTPGTIKTVEVMSGPVPVRTIPYTRAKLTYIEMRARFLQGLAKGLTQTQAAREAGYQNPDQSAHRLLKNHDTQQALIALLEAKGAGLVRMSDELDKGLRESTADGKRIDWFDRLARLYKLPVDKPNAPSVQVNTQANGASVYQSIVSQFSTSGIVEDDGTMRPYKGKMDDPAHRPNSP